MIYLNLFAFGFALALAWLYAVSGAFERLADMVATVRETIERIVR